MPLGYDGSLVLNVPPEQSKRQAVQALVLGTPTYLSPLVPSPYFQNLLPLARESLVPSPYFQAKVACEQTYVVNLNKTVLNVSHFHQN